MGEWREGEGGYGSLFLPSGLSLYNRERHSLVRAYPLPISLPFPRKSVKRVREGEGELSAIAFPSGDILATPAHSGLSIDLSRPLGPNSAFPPSLAPFSSFTSDSHHSSQQPSYCSSTISPPHITPRIIIPSLPHPTPSPSLTSVCCLLLVVIAKLFPPIP